MGLLMSLPLAGGLTSIATSCFAGLAFCFTSHAASLFFKSCNCNSSIATRVGFAIIFCLNSILAWIMKTDAAIKLIEKWSFDYIKMECAGEKCYGVLAVHRICFALALYHLLLSATLVGVQDTRNKRAALQNGWWGPKVLVWLILVGVSFTIPNGFFMFWGNYVALIGATIFILLGLVLLVDFAHSWSEMCLEKWENSSSNLWQWVLIGSTLSMYAFTITLTGLLYAYFAGSGCTLNQFFISFNLALCVVITIMSVHPIIQEHNPRSGLAQAAMVAAYCTYLIVSALSNHVHETKQCNPLRDGKKTRKAVLVLGGIFTFLAIAYSTTRAATQSKALVGNGKKGRIHLPEDDPSHSEMGVVTTQPGRTESPRYQALLAAVEAGAIPASALQEEEEEEEDEVVGEARDDELTGTRYNYSWFHIIFSIAAMYVAMLLTDWNVVSKQPISGPVDPDYDVYIGRSEVAMWMRVVSGWVCMVLYIWSLLAPVILPDRQRHMADAVSQDPEAYKSLYVNNYLAAAAFTILYYDYFLTFNSEYNRFWRTKGLTWASSLFYLNRYLSLFGHVPVIVQYFWSSTDPDRLSVCNPLVSFHQYLAVIVQVIVGIMLILRTYALYNRKRIVLAILCISGLTVIIYGVWCVLSGGSRELTVADLAVPGCLLPMDEATSSRLASAWTGMLAFDVLIFFMTLYISLTRKREDGDSTIIHVMLRDGTIYFGVMMVACVSVILTFHHSLFTTWEQGMTTTVANVLSSTMVSRLMLNLRDPKLSAYRLQRSESTTGVSQPVLTTVIDTTFTDNYATPEDYNNIQLVSRHHDPRDSV
ncbi:unnamed protein product [Cyclocybe aegerita]|uniref:DUF6533 domain-containing protein n=1 Tax=Cyclocybe aegerita TaxID=1973307 RepID=A0A8S0VS18_CYCAE|nr:unnamed protein product [Cyclocybe aegerita]